MQIKVSKIVEKPFKVGGNTVRRVVCTGYGDLLADGERSVNPGLQFVGDAFDRCEVGKLYDLVCAPVLSNGDYDGAMVKVVEVREAKPSAK